jgi:glycosyltransferase involved in cell wall biosynthesis
MRILHVIPQFPYFGGRTVVGGHASCLLTLAVAQHKAGHEVTILSYTAGCTTKLVEGGPVLRSLFQRAKTRTARFGLQFCYAAAKWVRPRQRDFDVIHVHSGAAEYFIVSNRMRKVARLPTLHTLYCPIPPSGRTRLPVVQGMVRRWANRLDWIGGISDNVKASMSEFGMQGVERIRPPLDVERFCGGDRAATRQDLKLSPHDLVVLFVGNATRQKNLMGVLHALHQLRDEFPTLKLIVTTELKHSASDADMARLGAEIDKLSLGGRIIQKGIVDDMPALMRACDVLVAPFFDTFGPSDYFMAALEAMATARPVVVSSVGGMREIISPDVGTFVEPQDPASIAAGLRAYLSDQPLRERVGANAQHFVRQNFNPQTVVGAYDEVYRRISS